MNSSTSNQSNAVIKERLNHANFHSWKTNFETVLQQKVLLQHITFQDFASYRLANYQFPTRKEAKYFKIKSEIEAKPITLDPLYSEDNKDTELEEHETTFKDDFKSFEAERLKQLKSWNDGEQQVMGLIRGCIEESIWQDIRCLKSVFAIWNQLRISTHQQEAGTWLALCASFFNCKMKDNERLTTFVNRVTQIHEKIVEIGDAQLAFSPVQIALKILSAVPNADKYQQILQAIHQLPKDQITVETIKSKFSGEDSRLDGVQLQNKERQEANSARDRDRRPKPKENGEERKCTTSGCPNMIPSDSPSRFIRCSPCQGKWIQENNFSFKKSNQSQKKEEKASVVLALSSTNLSKQTFVKNQNCQKSSKLYVDSACTSHISNGCAKLIDISKDSTIVRGCSGEEVVATGVGKIAFKVEDGLEITFNDALIVPAMERNLLSVRKITEASENIFVIFNQDKVEIFKGSVERNGETLIQGCLDDSKLYALSDKLNGDAVKPRSSKTPLVTLMDDSTAALAVTTVGTHGDLAAAIFGVSEALTAALTGTTSAFQTLSNALLSGNSTSSTFDSVVLPVTAPLLAVLPSNNDAYGTNNPMPNFFEEVHQSTTSMNVTTRSMMEWHLALAHISKKNLMRIHNTTQNFKIKDPMSKIVCLDCDAAKMKRKNFADSIPPRAENVGEVVYSDICGQINPPTINGEKYVITFLDEKSGYIAVFLAKRKSEAADLFKQIRAKFNNSNRTTSIKMLVTDGGGEYISEDFEIYLKTKGIAHSKTPPNTPQRNGKAERLNKILFDLARAMLRTRRMPRRFWGYAILYAAYCLNRVPKSGKDEARMEMLFGIKPDFKDLLEFGTPVMFHNHDPHIKKLDDRSFEGIFLGFHEDDHTFKIYDTQNNTVISTRTIRPHSDQIVEFEDNDFGQFFEVSDVDEWFTVGQSNFPQALDFLQSPIVTLDNFVNNQLPPIFNDQLPPIVNNQLPPIVNNQLPPIVNNQLPPIVNNQLPPIVNNQLPPIVNNQLPPIVNNQLPPIVNNQPLQNVNHQLQPDLELDIMGNPIFEEVSDEVDDQPAIVVDPAEEAIEEPQPNRYVRANGEYPLRNRVQLFALSVEEVDEIKNLAEVSTPKNFKEAMNSEFADEWKTSIQDEQRSLLNLNTFTVVNRPKDMPVVKSRYVFKIKTDEDGAFSRFKTRLVAKGYTQTEGVDYFETFSPALRLESFRFFTSSAVMLGMEIRHLDVQTAFLNGDLDEEIYMEIPEAFDLIDADRRNHVLKLNKAIYGLKQASRNWNKKFTSVIVAMGFVQSLADPCIFYKYNQDGNLISAIGIFVDDCLIAGGPHEIELASNKLKNLFAMHDLGLLSFALGIKFEQSVGSIKLSQTAYIDKILEKYKLMDATPCNTPLPSDFENDSKPFENIHLYQSLIGSLIYLMNATRPDIAYAVSYLARSMQKPTEENWRNAKQIVRYLKGTRNVHLEFRRNDKHLFGYSDASYAEEKNRKSVSGYVFQQAGASITWRSSKQPIIAQSSMEAEYIALAEAAKECEWLRKLQKEFFPKKSFSSTIIFEDNQSAIKLTKNPLHSNRSKHIDVRYHRIQELVATKVIDVIHLAGTEMVADIMTKSLGKILHAKFVAGLGLKITSTI